jgi:polyhydroxybutyrate depolymerase
VQAFSGSLVSMSPVRFSNSKTVFLVVSAIFLATFVGTPSGNAAQISFSGPRPFKLFVPSTYNASFPAPLIIALHGYSQTGDKFEKYLNLTSVAQARGILYVYPNGTADKSGTRFWNATPQCCDIHTPKVNDSGYLMSIIDQVSKTYSVDPDRIYIIGHSNGGFMANTMACLHADRIAAVVSMAGGGYADSSMCKPSAPINILEIWGTKDVTFKGNHMMGQVIPGAVKTAAIWGALDHCSKTTYVLPQRLDLDSKQKGAETTQYQYTECKDNADVEFWTIAGAPHVPTLSKNFTSDVVDFLLAHPKVTSAQSG